MHNVATDSMHNGDAGVFQDAIGSAFWFRGELQCLVQNAPLGLGVPRRKVYRAQQQLTPLIPLSQVPSGGMGAASKHPTLKSKAAQGRRVADFALALGSGTATPPPFRSKADHRLRGRPAPEATRHVRVPAQCKSGALQCHRRRSGSNRDTLLTAPGAASNAQARARVLGAPGNARARQASSNNGRRGGDQARLRGISRCVELV